MVEAENKDTQELNNAFLEYRPKEDDPKTPDHDLLFFVSFDVVGSTAFKQSAAHIDDWLNPLKTFLEGASELFSREYQSTDPVRIFKHLGDEVVLFADAKRLDLQELVRNSYKVLDSLATKLEETSPRLSAKAACWLVCIDGANNQRLRPKPLHGQKQVPAKDIMDYDFIGKHMDEGFRVAGRFSKRRQLALSFELAWMLAHQKKEAGAFFLLEPKELPGVWGGRPYPVIWYTESPNWSDHQRHLPYFWLKQCDFCREAAKLSGPTSGLQIQEELKKIAAYHELLDSLEQQQNLLLILSLIHI